MDLKSSQELSQLGHFLVYFPFKEGSFSSVDLDMGSESAYERGGVHLWEVSTRRGSAVHTLYVSWWTLKASHCTLTAWPFCILLSI